MAFTDQEIAANVDKLVAAGAPRDDIEKFVSSAKAAQSMGPTQIQVANLPATPAPAATGMDRIMQLGQIQGIANVPKIAPGKLVDIGLEAGGATLGQAAGVLAAPVTGGVSIPVLGALGGGAGNALAQTRRMMMGEQDKPNWGQLAGAGVSGAIPGVTQGKGVVIPIVKAGAAYGAGNVLAKAAETGINQGQLPTGAQALTAFGTGLAGAGTQKILGNPSFSPRDTLDSQALAVAAEAYKKGKLVTPPMELGMGNDAVSSIGQKAAINQQASKMNELGAQEMARETLGLSGVAPFKPGTPKTVDAAGREVPAIKSTFDDIRERAAAPYEELVAASPKTAKDLDLLRQQNKAVQDGYAAWRERKISKDDLDRMVNTQAALESTIDQAATRAGRPDLIPKLAVAKKTIAQSYAVENATNKGTGKVDMQDLANQLDAGIPLTDNLRLMALYAKSFPRSSVAGAPASGVSALNPMNAANMMAQETPLGAGMATAQMYLGPAARAYQLSSGAQNRYLSPSSGSQSNESMASALARFAAMNQGLK